MMERAKLIIVWLICCLAGLFSVIRLLHSIIFNPEKAWEIGVAFDRLANTSFNGSSRETISSRAYRAMKENKKWACRLCKLLDVFDKDHCKKSEGI
jgi:hypothetical protein